MLIIINSERNGEHSILACTATMGKQRDKREGVIREEREVEKEKKKILVKDIFILIFNGK